VAVLPIVTRADPNAEFLADGLTQSIISGLSELPNVVVKPWHSVVRYRSADLDLVKASNELNVDAVVTGRLDQREDEISIAVELIDVGTNGLLWGHQYRVAPEMLSTVPDSIADEITQGLRLSLSDEERGRLAAFRLYQRGRYHLERRRDDDLQRAVSLFNQVLAADPNHAAAHAGLANAYALLSYYGGLHPREAFARSKSSAQKALSLDDTLAEAHTALALVARDYDRDWPTAEREFNRAIELDPDYATSYQWYAEYLTARGRFNDALATITVAQKLAPTSLIVNATAGWVQYCAGQTDQAIAQLERVIQMDPEFSVAHWFLGWAYLQGRAFPKAIAELERAALLAPANSRIQADLAVAHARSGHKAEANRLLQNLKRVSASSRYVSRYGIATVLAALGDRDEAFDALNEAYEDGPWELVTFNVDPMMESLREDSRFVGMLGRLNLP
jgi:tetratricopeptide (TPR) repeat protein